MLLFLLEFLFNDLLAPFKDFIDLLLEVLEHANELSRAAFGEPEGNVPDFFIVIAVFVFEKNCLFALVQLAFSNNTLALLQLLLNSALLMNDTSICE